VGVFILHTSTIAFLVFLAVAGTAAFLYGVYAETRKKKRR